MIETFRECQCWCKPGHSRKVFVFCMKDRVKGFLLMTGGIVCIGVGLAGLVLPIIPGIPILLLGLHLMGVSIPILDRWTARVRRWLETRTAK